MEEQVKTIVKLAQQIQAAAIASKPTFDACLVAASNIVSAEAMLKAVKSK